MFCIIRPQYDNLEVKDLGIFLMQLLVVEASHSDGDSSQTQQGWALQDTEASGSIAFGRETHDNPSEPQSLVSTGEVYKQPTGRGLEEQEELEVPGSWIGGVKIQGSFEEAERKEEAIESEPWELVQGFFFLFI